MLAGDNGPSKRFRRLSVCVQEQCLPAMSSAELRRWLEYFSECVCVCVLKDVDQSTLVHITVLERHVLTFAHTNKHRPKQTHTGSPATTWRWTDAEMCSDSSQTLSVFGTDYVMATLTRGFKEGQGEWKGGRNKTILCLTLFSPIFVHLFLDSSFYDFTSVL